MNYMNTQKCGEIPMWQSKNYGNTDIKPAEGKYAVFIGRYQPYHRGHIELIEQKLNEGSKSLMT